MRLLSFRSLLFALGCAASACGPAAAGGLKAGIGREIITPETSIWMAGYAARKAPSDGKIHDLWAKAIAFEDETGAKSVIVTSDLLGLPRELSIKIAEGAEARFGLPRERLMLACSHTHCGPVLAGNLMAAYALDEEQLARVTAYTEKLPELFWKAIGAAIADLKPSRVSHGIGSAGFAKNRRQQVGQAVGIGVNPAGPVDHSVPVLKVQAEGGGVRALLFGYACHNTTLSFQQICGDYAGFAQIEVEKAFPGAAALFVTGCGADANPDPRGTLELAEQHGTALADAVKKTAGGEMRVLEGPIRAAFREVALPLSTPPTSEEVVQQATDESNPYVQRRAMALLRQIEATGELATTYPYPLQAWAFGRGPVLVALGGEVVVDYALRIERELGGKEKFWPIAYANDVMAYIPSARILKEGGYEAFDSMIYYGLYGPWAPEVEETLFGAIRAMAAGLRGD